MTFAGTLLRLPPAGVIALAACGGNEPQALPDHTPRSYSLMIEGVPVSEPYTFVSGSMVRVRIKFFNAAQEDLDAVEAEHFGGLTFNPTSRASAVRVPDHHYQFDVTGGVPGSGSVTVGFGHDDMADEVSFPVAPVSVTP
jgi:hypothetical protein